MNTLPNHTDLYRVRDFLVRSPILIMGRTVQAGVSLTVYRHQEHRREVIAPYNGPIWFCPNEVYFDLLRAVGITVEDAVRFAGLKFNPQNKSPVPAQVPLVGPPPAPYRAPVPTEQSTSTTQTPNIMAKKKATQTAAPAAHTPPPAPVFAPPAGAPPPPAPVVAAPTTPAPAVALVPKDTKNDITRPSEGTTTGAVWNHADRISEETGKAATRADVIAACTADGINASTATTQFGKWAKYHGFTGDASPGGRAKAAPAAAAPFAPPAGTVDPAWKAGVDGYASAKAGQQVVNPFAAGTPECDQFTAGWMQAGAADQAAEG